jgi:hypothetical protein
MLISKASITRRALKVVPPASRILSRRSLCDLFILTSLAAPNPALAKLVPAQFFRTPGGILYFDEKLGTEPPPPASRQRLWTPVEEGQCASASGCATIDPVPQAAVHLPGDVVVIDYRVRQGGWDGEIVALSDGIGDGGSIRFLIGDGTVNAAVDEVVRTLPDGVRRRAIVPAVFDLDRGRRQMYPYEAPPGITYLEISLRKPSATASVGGCDPADPSYPYAGSCICVQREKLTSRSVAI